MQYISSTLDRLPFAILEMPFARFVQNWVLLKPAATTLMAPIMMTLLFEKYARASFAVRQPVRASAEMEVIATVARLHTPVM